MEDNVSVCMWVLGGCFPGGACQSLSFEMLIGCTGSHFGFWIQIRKCAIWLSLPTKWPPNVTRPWCSEPSMKSMKSMKLPEERSTDEEKDPEP